MGDTKGAFTLNLLSQYVFSRNTGCSYRGRKQSAVSGGDVGFPEITDMLRAYSRNETLLELVIN